MLKGMIPQLLEFKLGITQHPLMAALMIAFSRKRTLLTRKMLCADEKGWHR